MVVGLGDRSLSACKSRTWAHEGLWLQRRGSGTTGQARIPKVDACDLIDGPWRFQRCEAGTKVAMKMSRMSRNDEVRDFVVVESPVLSAAFQVRRSCAS